MTNLSSEEQEPAEQLLKVSEQKDSTDLDALEVNVVKMEPMQISEEFLSVIEQVIPAIEDSETKEEPAVSLASVIENTNEDNYIELVNIEDSKTNVSPTFASHTIEPKNQGSLFSKVAIGTVSTAVVLVSIILGSR